MHYCFKFTGYFALTVACLAAAGPDTLQRATAVVRVDRRTGRLVRAVVTQSVIWNRSAAAVDAPVSRLVEQTARNHELDPLLVHSVIQAESSYNPFAVSPKGAQGLMQLMPSTARRFGVSNSFNVAENIEGGVRYLRHLLDLFQDEKLAVAAYNAGEAAVIRYGGIPPYPETRNYVQTVSKKYASARKANPAGAEAKIAAVAPPEPVYRPIERFVDEQGIVYLRTR